MEGDVTSVSKARPGCVLFLIDHSRSMMDGIGGSPRPKAEAVATAVNKLIEDLILRCRSGDARPEHWFDVGCIGYTTDMSNRPVVAPALGGPHAGKELVPLPELSDHPVEVETRKRREFKKDGKGRMVGVDTEVKFPVWYRSPPRDKVYGGPMYSAMDFARPILQKWIESHRDSPPPLVVSLTDAEPNDMRIDRAAAALRELATKSGRLVLMHGHVSDRRNECFLFPDEEKDLPDDYAKSFFRMSSPMPDVLRPIAEKWDAPTALGSRLMAYDADGVSLLKLLRIVVPNVWSSPSGSGRAAPLELD